MKFVATAVSVAFALISSAACAADYPAPKQASWIAKDFRFHTGEILPELKLHYVTVGAPTGEPVLESKLASRYSGRGLAPLIPEGMRACAITTNEASDLNAQIRTIRNQVERLMI